MRAARGLRPRPSARAAPRLRSRRTDHARERSRHRLDVHGDPSGERAGTALAAVTALPPRRVLVADDHRLIASLLERTFEDAGYAVTVVMDAGEVAAAVLRERPQLAIVDAQMKPYERF